MALFSRGNTPRKSDDKRAAEQAQVGSSRSSNERDSVSFFGRLRLGSKSSSSPSRPLPGQIKRDIGIDNQVEVQDKPTGKSNSEEVTIEAQGSGDAASQVKSDTVTTIGKDKSDKAVSGGGKHKSGFVAGLFSGLSFSSSGLRESGSSGKNTSSSVGSSKSPGTISNGQSTETDLSVSASDSDESSGENPPKKTYHETQIVEIISRETVDLTKLRALCWNGIPFPYRTLSWQLMLGYLPSNRRRREAAIVKKRTEYRDSVHLYFDSANVIAGASVYGKKGEGRGTIRESELGGTGRTQEELALHRQILVDLPRTTPELPFFHHPPIQRMMERVLYIWSMRHPASGYVQGMNDLLTPLVLVAAQPYIATDMGSELHSKDGEKNSPEHLYNQTVLSAGTAPKHSYKITATTDILRFDVKNLSDAALDDIEADSYWMFTKLLDNVQDHYTFSQPGLQRMVLRLEDVVKRHCPELSEHLQNQGVMFMQFAFRWMNCILLRELPLRCVLRLWDTYFAEERNGFENFHVYVCVVLLKMHESQLLDMSFQEIIIFLQDLPTASWTENDIDPVLSQAYILSTLYDQSGHV